MGKCVIFIWVKNTPINNFTLKTAKTAVFSVYELFRDNLDKHNKICYNFFSEILFWNNP